MRRRPRTTFILSFLTILLLFATFSLTLSRNALSRFRFHSDIRTRHTNNLNPHNNLVNEFSHQKRRVSSINFKDSISTVSILLPDWEILLIVSPNTALHSAENYRCLFRNNAFSPAKFSGVLPFTNRTTFKCDMPESVRRRRIFSQPVLVSGTSENEPEDQSPAIELMRWNFLVYESFSTDHDVVLFAKGVNHRQGYDRSPKELRCVFSSGDGNTVRTAVTSSVQEAFRCPHPDPSELGSGSGSEYQSFQENEKIGISLEIIEENLVVPSVAYYTPSPNYLAQTQAQPKYSLCACTMVYNVGKFLREWVMYHSKVGVENFILYDNGSEDDLESVVNELRGGGYNISTLLWIWPKTQEAGFSHSVVNSKSLGLCNWIMYVDVDEFVFSPLWRNGNDSNESHSLKSMLPRGGSKTRIGQVSIGCFEFGPSGQRKHPLEGVTQGYTCRRRVEQRHKSILLVDAVDPSLRNVIHHFHVNEKEGFRSKQIGMEEGVVNHYKYQAWDEFKSKFRRRVSAYVVDWTQAVNPKSKDRTPGLGFQPIEPKDWVHKFCEVRDHRLQSFTKACFGSNGSTMAWQSS